MFFRTRFKFYLQKYKTFMFSTFSRLLASFHRDNLRDFEAYSITQIMQFFTCLYPVKNFLVFLKSTENIFFTFLVRLMKNKIRNARQQNDSVLDVTHPI